MKILYLTSAGCCDQEDVLYAGLVEVLGRENVVDYPRKPSLHYHSGDENTQRYLLAHPRDMYGYHPTGSACHLRYHDGIFRYNYSLIRDFEAVIISCPRCDPVFAANRLWEQQGTAVPPIFLLDGEEHKQNTWDMLDSYGIKCPVRWIFKQFAPPNVTWDKTTVIPCCANHYLYELYLGSVAGRAGINREINFIGECSDPIRERCMDALRRAGLPVTGGTNMPKLDYATYLRHALSTQINLNFAGAEFCTRRYWEFTAIGAFMATQKPTVNQGPYDFLMGKHVAHFRTPDECVDVCRYYLDRPELCASIAADAQLHSRRYHSLVARGEQAVKAIGDLL